MQVASLSFAAPLFCAAEAIPRHAANQEANAEHSKYDGRAGSWFTQLMY